MFFDLVFVFSFTQVSRLMAESHSAIGVLQGMTVLGMLWGLWASFGWLSNQARADRGLVRTGLPALGALAVVTALVVALLFAEELLDRWWRDRATAASGDVPVSAESEGGA